MKWLYGDSNSTKILSVVSRLVGIVYLIAFIPMLFELKPLIGANGLQPAAQLLEMAKEQEGLFALLRFPSLFWLFPHDGMLMLLATTGIMAAIAMVFNFQAHLFSLFAWACFTSICTIGGDFYVIIIDLFLSEVGFLIFLSNLSVKLFGFVPNIVFTAFAFLNFRLWFSMGMNKFYFAHEMWRDGSFFRHFFPNQPMPTPLAYYAAKFPQWSFWTGEVWVFIVQLIIPFFVFGKKSFRWVAMLCFMAMSIAIMLTGNYGYFNILSMILAIALLRDEDFQFLYKQHKRLPPPSYKSKLVATIAASTLVIQCCYVLALFDPKPPGYQNHFNQFFLYESWQKGIRKVVSTVAKPLVFLRITNPYGVFKAIPDYRIELRFSGSNDGREWKPYEFKYVPSSNTQALKFFAPYYPRLDHLLFYESINAGGYNFNLLNPYYTRENVWTCRFVEAIKSNDSLILSLLAKNPFQDRPPTYVQCEAHYLEFDKRKRGWVSDKVVLLDLDENDCKPIRSSQSAL